MAKHPRLRWWVGLTVSVVAAAFSAVLAVQIGQETHALRDHGRVADHPAVVTDSQPQGKGRYVDVRFTTAGGHQVDTYLERWLGYPTAGDTIPVRYLPEDPQVALDARVRVWYADCVLSALFSVGCAVTGGVLVARRP